MRGAGLPLLDLRYLTGHATTDIVDQYSSARPASITAYFDAIRPLIDAVVSRCRQLGMQAPAAPRLIHVKQVPVSLIGWPAGATLLRVQAPGGLVQNWCKLGAPAGL